VELYAARSIDASPETIFGFLERFERHLELIEERVTALSVEATGSHVRLRGPVGVRRRVQTRLTHAESPRSIVGTVTAGRRTHGTVRWSIESSGSGSWVQVVARADTLGLVDRVLLRLGGRRWLARSLEQALDSLDTNVRRGAREEVSRGERL
jgi:carbon monoxide dehydrogenase subunit G